MTDKLDVPAFASSEEARHIMVHDDPVLETRDLSIYYGSAKTIHNISMTVPRNRITALIGPRAVARARCYVPSTG